MSKIRSLKAISVVIPVFNEEKNLILLHSQILKILQSCDLVDIEFIFIDDGSVDDSFNILNNMAIKDKSIKIIKFTRNFGHQYALLAGIKNSKNDACLMMDADLEHPPQLIPELIKNFNNGYDVVNTIRLEGDEPWFKKWSSSLFYKIMTLIGSISIPDGASDFRIISKKVIMEVSDINSSHLFLRGYFYWLGFPTVFVEYKKQNREHGVTGYTFKKMLSLSFNALTTFSILPLRIAIILGSIVSFIGFALSIYIGYRWFFLNNIDISSAAIAAEILIIGGFIILFLGVVGEYIGRIFIEVKSLPRYVIEETKNINE